MLERCSPKLTAEKEETAREDTLWEGREDSKGTERLSPRGKRGEGKRKKGGSTGREAAGILSAEI